ncbi:MAG: hypothetical protein ABSF99_10645 [Anaerolineales bacterium]
MPAKHKKDKRPRPPKVNSQIPLSRVRPIKILGPRYYLQHAREYPILGCWIMSGWKKEGITPVIVARQQEPDKVIFAVCLVDLYCLGVKDAYANADFSQAKFLRQLPHMCGGAPEPCSAELAHEIIYGGLEYAQHYGFQPHRDFTAQMCDQVLDPPEAHSRINHVKFGYKGKPFFVSGPYDDERRINSVVKTLMNTAGEGNFHYMVGSGPPDFFDE